jgi:hypothetical protein
MIGFERKHVGFLATRTAIDKRDDRILAPLKSG